MKGYEFLCHKAAIFSSYQKTIIHRTTCNQGYLITSQVLANVFDHFVGQYSGQRDLFQIKPGYS